MKYLVWWKKFMAEHDSWKKRGRFRKCKEGSSRI